MEPIIDHIHITVQDLDRAEKFYDRLLPLLGYDITQKEHDEEPEDEYRIVEYHHRNLSIGIVTSRKEYEQEKICRRKPGALHHLAFRVPSKGCVDTLFAQVSSFAAVVHEPQFYPEYCDDYYAFFFKDSEGIELEIVHLDRAMYF